MENVILTCLVGSQAYGIATADSDSDHMGVYVESRVNVMGLFPHDQVVQQGSELAEDQVFYSLRKWAKLASRGNPTVLELLYAPVTDAVRTGYDLRDHSHLFISRAAAGVYLDYAKQQRERLDGVRGQKNIKRIELVERFGYDTKYASQILRLLHQGIGLMENGQIQFPLPEAHRAEVMSVKLGEWSKDDVMARAEELESDLKAAREKSDLPEHVDLDAINNMLVEMHEAVWYP